MKFRRVLGWLLRAALLLLSLLVGAIAWFTPLSTGYARMGSAELEPYVEALRRTGAPPIEYVVSRFADHPVVIVGEHHRVAQEVEFVQDLIPEVYHRAGVRRLLIEFGVASDRADVDRLLEAPEFDRALAKRLLANLGLFWLYEEYLGLYEAAWKLNRSLAPGQPPFRILLACPSAGRGGEKDAWMARAVEEEVERGEKVLVHCGSHHGFTRYQQPLPFLDLLPGGRPSVRMPSPTGAGSTSHPVCQTSAPSGRWRRSSSWSGSVAGRTGLGRPLDRAATRAYHSAFATGRWVMRALLAILAATVVWADAPAWDQPGPYEVKTAEHPDLTDKARDGRSIPLKAYYPTEGRDLPIVVISHGGGGKWDSSSEQARHLASHGYLVVCPTHVDSSNERIRHYMSKAGGRMSFREALHQITIDRAAVLERPKDISFAIDQAIQWNDAGDLKDRIDAKKVALMGHSFGAYTTLVVCGARPTYDDLVPHIEPKAGLAPDLSDPRVVFGLAMSPQSPEGCFFGEESYRTINRPLVCLSGSKDEQKGADAGTLPAESRRRAWELIPPGEKWLLWLENADHMSFSYNPDSKIQLPSPAREDAQRISRAVMLLSCEVFLRGNEAAKADFNSEYLNTLCGKVVTKIEWCEK